MNYIFCARKKAFTLIELLVVIAIIGILATIVIFNVTGATAKARDSKRMSDLNSISKAFQVYYEGHNTYLVTGTGYQSSGIGFFNYAHIAGVVDNFANESINDGLVRLGYLSGTVIDPTGGTNYDHYYLFFYSGPPSEKASVYAMLENTPPNSADLLGHSVQDVSAYVGTNYAVTLIP